MILKKQAKGTFYDTIKIDELVKSHL